MPRTRNQQPLPDLVYDSKLETYIQGDCTEHVFYETGRSLRERHKRRVESWEREHTLGNGSFGVVYREKRLGSSRPIYRAVKKISKRVVEGEDLDYIRELEAVAKFSHHRYSHCFVRSDGWFEMDDAVFITMEYLEHGDLQKYLTRPFPETEAAPIVAQVLEGLEFMHSSGFVHRDLKPGNIMVVETGPSWYVKIADFGISKRRQQGVTTLHTMQRGTLGFAAPEVLGMDTDADEPISSYSFSVDMWSLGAVTFYLLTNLMAFATSAKTVMYALGALKFPIEPLESRQISEEGTAFIKSLLSLKPEDRPTASTAASHQWLDSYVMTGDSPENSPSPSTGPPSVNNSVAAEPVISLEDPVKRETLTTNNTTISSRASAEWPDQEQETLKPASVSERNSPTSHPKLANSPLQTPNFDLVESIMDMKMSDSPLKGSRETLIPSDDEPTTLPGQRPGFGLPEGTYDAFIRRKLPEALSFYDIRGDVRFAGQGDTMVPPERPSYPSYHFSRRPNVGGKSIHMSEESHDEPTIHSKIVEIGSTDEENVAFPPERPPNSSWPQRHRSVHVSNEHEEHDERTSLYDERPSHPAPAQQRSRRVSTVPQQERRVRVVSPNRGRSEKKPLKGILKPPRNHFPEHPSAREGVAPRTYNQLGKDIPVGARWTKIKGGIISPEALRIGKERFEERDDCIIVLRVLTHDEIVAYHQASQALLEQGKEH